MENLSKLREGFWIHQMKKYEKFLSLPLLRTTDGDRVSLELSIKSGLGRSLKLMNGQDDYNVLVFFFSTVTYLLGAFSNDRKFMVLVPQPKNRTSIQHPDRLLPIGTEIDKKLSFKELFLINRDTILSAIENQNSFTKEICKKELPGYQDYNSFVQVSYNRMHGETIESVGVEIRLNEEDDLFAVEVTFTDDPIHHRYIGEWLNSYEGFLTAIIKDTSVNLGAHQVLRPDQMTNMIKDRNQEAFHKKTKRNLLELFQNEVAKNENKPAFIFNDEILTYQQLENESDKLASYMMNTYNIQYQSIVAFILDSSPYSVIAILAIMKSGSSSLPMEPEIPDHRKALILQNAKPHLLLTVSRFNSVLFSQYPVIVLDFTLPVIPNEPPVKARLDPNDILYIIYTSGSTGIPKGVVVEQRGIVNTVYSQLHTMNLQDDEVILNFFSFTFDVAHVNLWMCLLSGSSLVQTSKEILSTSGGLTTYMEARTITVAGIPPVFLNNIDWNKITTLHTLFIGGEKAYIENIAKPFKMGIKIYNQFGVSESSCTSSIHLVTEADFKSEEISIGKPIHNNNLLVLDEDRQVVPWGVTGDIYITGIGLARGYLNNPELTSKTFVANPWQHGQIMYRTGDLGSKRLDGTIMFKDRSDRQVKINGQRIEIEEVELSAIKCPLVKDVVVDLFEDKIGGLSLVAYPIFYEHSDVPGLITFMRKHLTGYMIPSHFVPLKKIPITSNGKIDFAGLPSPDDPLNEEKQNYIAPCGEIETIIIDAFKHVLNKDRIGVTDDFFQSGGTSLKAIGALTYLAEIGLEIDLVELFNYPTARRLAERINIIGGSDNLRHGEEVIL